MSCTALKYSMLLAVLVLSSLAMVPMTQARMVYWTGSAGDGKWENAVNWSGRTLPEADDTASISLPFPGPSVVTISSAQTVFGITMDRGVTLSCTGTGILVVEGGGAGITNFGTIVNNNGGKIEVGGGSAFIANNAGCNLTSSGTIYLHVGSALITNSGIIDVSGDSSFIRNRGSIFNRIGGTITGSVTGNAVINERPLIQVTTTTKTGTATFTDTRVFTSTVRSTSYSYRYVATATSTQFATSKVTAFSQNNMDGPYVQIKATFRGAYEGESGRMEKLQADATVTNLLNVPIDKGTMYFLVSNLGGTVTEEAGATFGTIQVGGTINCRGGVGLTKVFYNQQFLVNFLRVDLVCGAGVTATVPIATYTNYKTQTDTYTDAYTITRTSIIQEPFLTSTTTIWLLLIVGGVAAIVVLFFFGKKRKTGPKPTAPTSSQQVSKPRACSSCGNKMEPDAEFCINCGKKWE